MSIQYINTGTGPNSGNGDSLRTAFNKVNSNFLDVDSRLSSAGTLIESSTPPYPATTTTIWFDTISGRSYVYFEDAWVDSSPAINYQLPAATTSTLGGIKVGFGLLVTSDGTLSVNTGTVGGGGSGGGFINGDFGSIL